MVNLFYDSYRILLRVYSDKAFIKQAINSEVVEPINKNTVIKICYGVVEKDIELEYIIKSLCDKRPKLPVRILLKISIYCIKYLQKAPHAVTDSAVELCKKLGKSGMSGFLNAILRKYIKNPQVALPENQVDFLSIKYSFPKFAVENLIADYGMDLAVKIMEYDLPHTFLRFADEIDGGEYLDRLGKQFECTPFKNTFMLKNFTREEGFFEGKYTFQSIGSVAICNAIDGGDSLLDCCAAPGGKSIALTNKFNTITACELHPHRAELIKDYAERMKVNNLSIQVKDATVYDPNFKEQFDVVLCDAPCSGFGVTLDNPDIRINREYENIEQLTEIQLKILNNVAKYVKSGGFLYYSTCSIFKKENDKTVEKFLRDNNSFKVVSVNSPLNHLTMQYGLQFLPNLSFGAGFYLCKMQKI